MQKSQIGFTLIELVVVIVLLGILGVTALGKYQDLSEDAQTAVNEGVASELSSAAAINFAASVIGTPELAVGDGFDCTTSGGLFASGSVPTGIAITGSLTCGAVGDSDTCAVVGSGTPAGTSFDAILLCTST
jgi:MSHA pilin protein MshA